LGSGQEPLYVGDDGLFKFDGVPVGDYTLSAGVIINKYWYSAQVEVHIAAGKTTPVQVLLQPPPEVNREVTITVEMSMLEHSFIAHGSEYSKQAKLVRLHPFHSHEHVPFDGRKDQPFGRLLFDIDLLPQGKIKIEWRGQEIDDDKVEAEFKGGHTLDKERWQSWTNGHVKSLDALGVGGETWFDFSVSNFQAPA
jgi:hypothetical protein